MWFDAKNVQFDAEKIQEALDKAFAIGGKNRDLINSGLTGVPIEVKVPLYLIRETRKEDLMGIPTPEEAEKGYDNFKEAIDNGSMLSALNNTSRLSTLNNRGNFLSNLVNPFKGGQKSQDKEFMREMEEFADFFKKTTNITVFAVFRAKLNRYYNRENYIYLEDVWHRVWDLKAQAGKNPKDLDLSFPMGHVNVTDDRLRKLIEVTKAIKWELRDDDGRYTWRIGITSEDSMLETCKALAENDALLDGLLEVTKDIYKKIHNKEPFNIGVPHVSYRVVEDVIALNLIKLVKKGTDVAWFSHTGETTSLVAEMLVKVDGQEERHGGNPLSLIKTVIKPFDYRVNDMVDSKIDSRIKRDAFTGKVSFVTPTSEPGTTTHTVRSDQIIMSDKFSSIKCVLTESFPYADFECLESFDKLRELLNKDRDIDSPKLTEDQYLELEKELEKEIDRDMKEEDAWHLEHGIDTTKVMVMSSDRLYREYHWSPFIYRTDDIDFWTLVLPRGKDLSESFKTKYV